MTVKKFTKMFEENKPLPQTVIKGYFHQIAHQKHDGTLVNFKRFCLNELAELTWAGLFEAVWRWPRASAKFELGYQGSKSKFSLILFAYNLMIGYSKKNRENFRENAFDKVKKNWETRVKI